ncbi:DEDD exonuclease domain-containing protein [Arcanobacterium phocisimile]|uniref:DEDD exonuclease domain-containing protein n=1 Tax=Arcanobacterium phocisimile TaxID=1302235 RepID=A0ABX7IJ29_9ACTO|nr:DEDD exonuclease domain-containing protein [Arcanobacterium phocisimile]QRV02860.1 DEDD exonuclease domain-containing protein [Arcanobacterium phocisimile]
MKNIRSVPPGRRLDTEVVPIHRRGQSPIEPQQLAFDDLGLSLEQATFLVVDVETTGEKPGLHSLTEIGAVKVRGGEVIGEFGTLVNPGIPIPAFISRLTGISTAMVTTAPSLAEVMLAFIEFIGHDSELIYVAHNARFDIGQLTGAAQAVGLEFPQRRTVDTVKLSRRVFTRDEVPNYKLSSLARLVGATTTPTHRALDDARATVDVLHAVLSRLGPLGVTHVDDLMTAHSGVPSKRRKKISLADGLPRGSGVYQFVGPNDEILYIGVSGNVYKRVRSYFTAAEKRRRIGEMVDLAERVEAIETATLIEAEILEIRLIREIRPRYNKRSKPRSRYWLRLTQEPHPRLTITKVVLREHVDHVLGPFTRFAHAKQAKELIESVSGLRTCSQTLPAVADGRLPCHMAELNLCDAPCVTGIEQRQACRAAAHAISGNLDVIYSATQERMAKLSQLERFEAALAERERLYALVNGAVAGAICLPLVHAGRIIAAAPSDEKSASWEVIVIDHGRFVQSMVVAADIQVHRFAEEFMATHPLSVLPERPFESVSTDELRCLSRWLWRDGVRIVVASKPDALSTPLDHAQKIKLPTIPGFDEGIMGSLEHLD